MSAGAFINSSYEDDLGTIHPVKIQPETTTLQLNGVANTAPSSAISIGVASARISGSKRAIGYNARTVRIRFLPGEAPNGYKEGGIIELPVLTAVAYAAYQRGTIGTYAPLGAASAIEFVGKSPETII